MANPVGRFSIVDNKHVEEKITWPPLVEHVADLLRHTTGKKIFTPPIAPRPSQKGEKMPLFEDLMGRMTLRYSPSSEEIRSMIIAARIEHAFKDVEEDVKAKIWQRIWEHVASEPRQVIVYLKVRMKKSVQVGAKYLVTEWPSTDDLCLRANEYLPAMFHVNRQSRAIAMAAYTPLFQARIARPIYLNLGIDVLQFKNFQAIKTLWGPYLLERDQKLPMYEDMPKLKNFILFMESASGTPAMHTRFLQWAASQECFVNVHIVQQSDDDPPEGLEPILTTQEKKLIAFYAEFGKSLKKIGVGSYMEARLSFVSQKEWVPLLKATGG